MIWALFVQLGQNMWWKEHSELDFDNEAWEEVISSAKENGINQIIIDVGEGYEYKSHPELTKKRAWSYDRVKAELKRCREAGIELIPKLNFSATHHLWLGEYRRMMSTEIYYKVCRELIEEISDAFEKPRFFHLGMDEEGDPQFFNNLDMVHYRQTELLMHDLRYFMDVVKSCGSTPMIWADPCMYNPEAFRKHVAPGEIVLNPWFFFAVRREHWTPVKSKQRYIDSTEGMLGIEYMEQAPIWQTFMREGIVAANDGYATIPCCSTWGECEYCFDDVVEYFMNNCKKENIYGFMTAPWKHTVKSDLDEIKENMKRLAKARTKFCK